MVEYVLQLNSTGVCRRDQPQNRSRPLKMRRNHSKENSKKGIASWPFYVVDGDILTARFRNHEFISLKSQTGRAEDVQGYGGFY